MLPFHCNFLEIFLHVLPTLSLVPLSDYLGYKKFEQDLFAFCPSARCGKPSSKSTRSYWTLRKSQQQLFFKFNSDWIYIQVFLWC